MATPAGVVAPTQLIASSAPANFLRRHLRRGPAALPFLLRLRHATSGLPLLDPTSRASCRQLCLRKAAEAVPRTALPHQRQIHARGRTSPRRLSGGARSPLDAEAGQGLQAPRLGLLRVSGPVRFGRASLAALARPLEGCLGCKTRAIGLAPSRMRPLEKRPCGPPLLSSSCSVVRG